MRCDFAEAGAVVCRRRHTLRSMAIVYAALPGDAVVLTGLKNKAMNGRRGIVVLVRDINGEQGTITVGQGGRHPVLLAGNGKNDKASDSDSGSDAPVLIVSLLVYGSISQTTPMQKPLS